MHFGKKNNRPAAAKSACQCALDHETAQNAAVAEAAVCEANGLEFEPVKGETPIFTTRKPSKAMTFTVDLHDAWARA